MLAAEIGAGFERQERERILGAIRDQLDEAAFAEAREKGRNLTVEEAVEMALQAAGTPADPVTRG